MLQLREPAVLTAATMAEGRFGRRHLDDARIRWLLFFAALYPVVALWSLTNPMFASPDENLHMVRAQAFARLDFRDPVATDGLPVESAECFAFMSEVPASCQDLSWGPEGTSRVTNMGGYPPLFHAVAAVPAIVTSGLKGAYLMRLWLGAVCVALVAWAGAIVTRPRSSRWELTGLLLAVTPMTLFTMATVNPSGMASAGAILMVAACLSLVARPRRHLPTILALTTGVATLALSRRDGVIWLAVLAVTLAPIAPWRPAREQLRQMSARRLIVGLMTAVAAVVVASVIAAPTVRRFYDNWRDGLGASWWESARYIRTYLVQAVGVFGWLDSPVGEEGFLLFMIAAGVLLVVGLSGWRSPLSISTLLSIFMLVLTIVLFSIARFPYLQGRYLLPIWAGGLLVAGAATGRARLPDREGRNIVRILVGIWLTVQGIAFVQNLRRYAVGRSGPWSFVYDGEGWHPPRMSNSVAVVSFGVAVMFMAFVVSLLLRDRHSSSSDLLGEASAHSSEDRPAEQQAHG